MAILPLPQSLDLARRSLPFLNQLPNGELACISAQPSDDVAHPLISVCCQ
jgi:hypothetical protein